MDQDETDVVEEPTPTETKTEEVEGKRGPILATLLIRVTIRYPFERTADDEALAKTIDLTNEAIAEAIAAVIERAIIDDIADTSDAFYDAAFTVNATVEKV